jgi:hypothetical protein
MGGFQEWPCSTKAIGYFDSPGHRLRTDLPECMGLLDEFGDAEIATLIAPRGLVVEVSQPPEIKSTKGDIRLLDATSVKAEFARIDRLIRPGFQPKALAPDSREALSRFLRMLGASPRPRWHKPLRPTSGARSTYPRDRSGR